MAQYQELWNIFTDYGSAINNTPWPSLQGTASVFNAQGRGGSGIRCNISATARQILAKAGETAKTDADAVLLIGRHESTGTSLPSFLCVRSGGTSNANFSGYLAAVYNNTGTGGNNGDELRIGKYVSGTLTSTLAVVSLPGHLTFPYFIRLRASGSNLMAKAWNLGAPEPASWQATATDTDLSSGRIGPGFANSGEYTFGPISVGDGGDEPISLNWVIEGSVFEAGPPGPNIPRVRTVRAIRRSNFRQRYETVSLSDGSFRIPVFTSDAHTVYVLDELAGSYNALISDRIAPIPVA